MITSTFNGSSGAASTWKPSGAGMTPLPPSPEIKPASSQISDLDPLPFFLGNAGEILNITNKRDLEHPSLSSSPSRLRSIAKYKAFSPQALACSDRIPQSFSCSNGELHGSEHQRLQQHVSGGSTRRLVSPHAARETASSLGAIAGAQGVAVFRMSKPHEPLLMLNHATSNNRRTSNNFQNGVHANRNAALPPQISTSGGRPVTALAFQPDAKSTFFLAAARGSGVLIWDVSGHSLSPLLGRLAMGNMDVDNNAGISYAAATTTSVSSESDNLFLTSLSWKLSAERDGVPLLATTTSFSACIWDLRTPVSLAKPSVRFGIPPPPGHSRKTTDSASSLAACSPYVQISCSRSHECATMDAAGTVRVFDIRMTDSTRYSMNSVAIFAAFAHAGVGISYLPMTTTGATGGAGADASSSSTTAWVTWGLDSPDADAVVKVWSSAENADAIKTNGSAASLTADDYVFVDGSPGRSSGNAATYRLMAQYSPPYHLACARVCPEPVENSILTIGILDNNSEIGMNSANRDNNKVNDCWRAELWKMRPPTFIELEANDGTFGMEKVISFDGGVDYGRSIGSALGRDSKIGQLQAAEVAITSYNAKGLKTSKMDDECVQDGINVQSEIVLTLCCLSDEGFVTTHVVPEALPKRVSPRSDLLGSLSPQRSSLFSNVGRTKVFADDREGGTVMDAARLWGSQGDRASTRPVSETRSSVEWVRNLQSSPIKENGSTMVGPQKPSQRNSDGAMLFEMDVPAVAYGTVTTGGISGVQIGDLTSPKTAVATSMAEETDNAAAHVRDVAAMAERMDNIETERIPCPRLCGATFGPGIGGLAVFNNGDVRKLWLWYDRAGSKGIPSSISAPEQAFSDPGNASNPAKENVDIKIPRDCPRTMKDLMEMAAAAKEAQWGEVNESGGVESDQEQSSADNFFEYMSTGSISSDSDNDPADFTGAQGGKDAHHHLYDNYFGNYRRPVAEPSGGNSSKKSEDNEHQSHSSSRMHPSVPSGQVMGPSSDTLAPSVHVRHDFATLALNNQSAELAREWELGQWLAEETINVIVNQERVTPRPYYSDQSLERYRETQIDPPDDSPVHRGLPSYRGLTPSPQKSSLKNSRNKSDPILTSMAPTPASPTRKVQIENEPGVHGGEYPVRPNMQESMVFLRKLFAHQQEGLLSPPDSPMIHSKGRFRKNLVPVEQFQKQGDGMTRHSLGVLGDKTRKPGVYALRSDAYGTGDHQDDKKLSQVKSLCVHNAGVCEKFGEKGKEGVWKLLVQMVDRRLNERQDAFNGWGGKGGGALGVDLVANIMRYYENLGDVQMLATMVCVLSGGRPRSKDHTVGHLFLLPTGQDEKYDTYIRRYSDLLFGWGLLVKRAELNKHLVQHIQENVLNDATNNTRSPGISLVFTCPRCGKDAEFGTNICRFCQEYAFKCSICDNGVRGLFTVCHACGHGGHVNHITAWFAKHAQCPAGCGCICTFASHQQRRNGAEATAPRVDVPL